LPDLLRCPRDWGKLVNRVQTEAELKAIRRSVNRGRPYGEDSWIEKCAEQLGLEFTLRPRGRPRKSK
jgi:putative transposase